MAGNRSIARERADAQFKQIQKPAAERDPAKIERDAENRAVDEKTARLKSQRLAKTQR